MSGDFNDLRTSLRQSVEAFRPPLDASDLADAGRARSRRRRGIGALVATLAVALAALLGAPSMLGPGVNVPAAPVSPTASDSAPTIAPMRAGDATGSAGAAGFAAMAAPRVGAVTPDGTWREVTVLPANLRVVYPPSWKAFDDQWGVIWLKAPSGYSLSIVSDGSGAACTGVPPADEQQLASVDLVPTENEARGRGPVVIRWRNGGTFPVSVNLAQHNPTSPCWQLYVNYGGIDNIYLGSAANTVNPTAAELDEAVAILVNAARIH